MWVCLAIERGIDLSIINTYKSDIPSRDKKRDAGDADKTKFPCENDTDDCAGYQGRNGLNNAVESSASWER